MGLADEEKNCIAEAGKLYQESGRESGFYHLDIPFTVETQLRLSKEAGFQRADVLKKWNNTTIIKYYK